ncbi:zymogen granule membrane protein 16 isoform X1 [Eurytemora carolleeae]|uniref:zymogen granule membrane protein 16 isoform X1 n=1 Tax=Eurytemora carolleeae TaxID=1294199 RepID=UPI000C77677A|nr:zymogen granule membrane protein 16 isoform X1 [Eurytemora carolleeae]|eukprot:XP_023329445.1 zymogen granule membrane protein 16-like isoform X1 [Eurytemora affinis]
MERFVALLLLVSGIPEGLEARSFKRLTETISVENGTLTRGVIEDGPFGGNGGGGWTDGGEVHLNGHPSALDVRTGSKLDALRIRYGDVYGDWHGGGGGSPHSCEWDAGDEVFIVQGRAGSEIDEIEFITLGGQICGPFGGGGGGTWVSTHPGCVLEYLSGNSGSRIDSLTIHWSCETM